MHIHHTSGIAKHDEHQPLRFIERRSRFLDALIGAP